MIYTRLWRKRVAYLYGDSTESPLEVNYIEFLRDALDFAVEILVSDHRVQGLEQGSEDKTRVIEQELGLIQQVTDRVVQALDSPPGPPQGSAHRLAGLIRQAADEATRRTVSQLKQGVADHLSQLATHIQKERASTLGALELLLRHRDLPGSASQVEILFDPAVGGYKASVRGKADIGLEWLQSLDIPTSHLFGNLIRVERLSPNLEVRVPEKSGWMNKKMRVRAHRIANKVVLEILRSAHQTIIKLRANPEEDDEGYNLLVTQMEPRVRLVRVLKGGEHSPPFEPNDDSIPRFLDLANQLTEGVLDLSRNRGPLRDARIDGKAIAECDNPSILVQRLISKMAPVVQEIARHSLSPGELVLKRILADDRREEIFASKTDLLNKLDPVPLALRGVFAPLGLGDLGQPGASGVPSAGWPVVTAAPAGPSRMDTAEPEPITNELRIENLGRARDLDVAGAATIRGSVAARPHSPSQQPPPATATGRMGGANPRPAVSGRATSTTPPPLAAHARGSATTGAPPPSGSARGTPTTPPPPSGGVRGPATIQPGVGPGGPVVPRPPAATSSAAHPRGPHPGGPHDDDDVTMVAAQTPNSKQTGGGEDSIDVALSELESEN